jgi:NAD(P)-dependent dehydrogenase (short-subunit alcohol dehydrogenase family)
VTTVVPAESIQKQEPRRVAIVTGGARGLGRSMSLALTRSGIQVVVAHLPSSADAMDELSEIIEAEGHSNRPLAVECDVTDWRDCENVTKKTVERFGAVHSLVNNAGIGMQNIGNVLLGKRKAFYEVDAEAWRKAVDVNVNGAFLMAKAITPHLVAQGWGRIVNIETSFFTMMMDGFSPYGPSKAALESATVIWAKDLATTGVTVNALLPGGPANTRMIPHSEVSDRESLIQPKVMDAPIVWLLSSRSDGVTGRRIVAKDWDEKRLFSEAPGNVGTSAGW